MSDTSKITDLRDRIAEALSCLYCPDQDGAREFDRIAAERILEIIEGDANAQ